MRGRGRVGLRVRGRPAEDEERPALPPTLALALALTPTLALALVPARALALTLTLALAPTLTRYLDENGHKRPVPMPSVHGGRPYTV